MLVQVTLSGTGKRCGRLPRRRNKIGPHSGQAKSAPRKRMNQKMKRA